MAVALVFGNTLTINLGHATSHHAEPTSGLKIFLADHAAHPIQLVGGYINQKVIGRIVGQLPAPLIN